MFANPFFFGLLLSFLAILLDVSDASYVFNVYRALQFDKGGRQFGSRKTYMSIAAAAFDVSQPPSPKRRQVLATTLEELTRSSIDVLLQSTSAGVLVLMPKPEDLSVAAMDAIQYLERRLLTESFDFPVYLAPLTEELAKAYTALQRRLHSPLSSTADEVSLVVPVPFSTEVKDIPVVSMQGTLHGAAGEEGDASTFAIVTHYDTMGAFPGFPGADHHRSGVAALFELARLFSRLYAAARGPHHLQYVLSGAGRLNYFGTRQWLQQTAPATLDAIEFALCLESIAGERLYLHTSKRPRDAAVRRLYETFNQTAERRGIPFTIVWKKINVSGEELAWEHEAFAFKKVVAATLSDQPAATPQFSRASPLNTALNPAVLERNIAFVAEVVAQHVYGVQGPNVTVFRGSTSPSSHHVAAWLRYLAATPRSAPQLQKDSAVLDVFEKALRKHVTQFRRDDRPTSIPLRSDFTFYAVAPAEMQWHHTKPLLFDLALLVGIAAYLLGINVYFRGFDDIRLAKSMVRQRFFGADGSGAGARLKKS